MDPDSPPSQVFPAVAQPVMKGGHLGPGSDQVHAMIDNRTGMPDGQVQQIIEDQWVELAGLQFAQPSTFQLYSNYQSSMLARTPFKTPGNVIEEIELARTIADSDDDVAATFGQMLAIAFGEGLQNHHRDENTLEFFNQMTAPTALDLESLAEELYREYLIAGSVTTLTLFGRQRLKYFPLKSDEPVEAQLQVPHVGVIPAENLRVISNDVMNTGILAYHCKDMNMKRWLDEYFSPTVPGARKAMMAIEEPVAAALFTGRIEVPFTDSDINTRGLTLYTLNQRMVNRTSMAKGALPYARPLLTRNFALLEAKRLLNIMDYALLQGGTNYIVIAKKGTDNLPAQQPEIENLVGQVTHASRSGVLVGDHRLSVEIITPDLEELLNPSKRSLLGRKISTAILRQTEQNTMDGGGQSALNEMELLARIVSADRGKILRHVQSTFYNDTANRNRGVFKQGAPTIWAPKIILAGAKDFWSNVLNARDRGDIPRRWAVEALGFNYDAGLAEREREIARGDDYILTPGAVPFSQEGEPQDNNEGRPPGTSTNNGRGRDTPGQGKDPAAPERVIRKTAGETVKAIVEGTEVSYVGETTLALIEGATEELSFGYTTALEREAIEEGRAIRNGQSVILPVNREAACVEFRTAKLGDGLRIVVGKRIGDEAIVVKALRFTEPHYDLLKANDYALRWGFILDPMTEHAGKVIRCKGCGQIAWAVDAMNTGVEVCVSCGTPVGGSLSGDGDADVAGMIVCPECHGRGKIEGGTMIGPMICPECKGAGMISSEGPAPGGPGGPAPASGS
jgi:hypothetical protein